MQKSHCIKILRSLQEHHRFVEILKQHETVENSNRSPLKPYHDSFGIIGWGGGFPSIGKVYGGKVSHKKVANAKHMQWIKHTVTILLFQLIQL
ncbi:hypothetical protein BPUM_1650 [Bacillus pumilus SAFR-032]|uniref:Uncharacterized protein n=1 Tax=Bacillus pumilus (strain SAFR-032) TaxID=315750 RepID=A8FDL2_BACP2|nr:hypothetical protein BPUM_1650 [Bacillus pumilus SAFR-032]